MGGILLGMSFFATYSSTNSFVGFAGQSYAYGAPWMLLAPSTVIFSLLAWTIVAPRLRLGASGQILARLGFRWASLVPEWGRWANQTDRRAGRPAVSLYRGQILLDSRLRASGRGRRLRPVETRLWPGLDFMDTSFAQYQNG